jgi:tetratricopeptide (TPR) repeat protein
MSKALEYGRRAADMSKRVNHRTNVALYMVYAGDATGAEKEAQKLTQENPQFLMTRVALAMAQASGGKLAEAAKTYESMRDAPPRGGSAAELGLADLALVEGRLKDAMELLPPAIAADLAADDKSAAAVKVIALAEAYALAGQTHSAIEAANRAMSLDSSESVTFAAGRILAEKGQEMLASKLAARLSGQIELEPQIYGKLLEGEVQLAKRDYRKALVCFEEAQRLADTWLGRVALGRAYLAAGAYTEASSELEIALRRRGEAAAVFLDERPTFRYLAPVHYYLGLAQAGLNSPAAQESFEAFLAIKKKGDQTALVADAKRRAEIH